ncbi:hypothetical protein D3C74_421240 [compost metagenome]
MGRNRRGQQLHPPCQEEHGNHSPAAQMNRQPGEDQQEPEDLGLGCGMHAGEHVGKGQQANTGNQRHEATGNQQYCHENIHEHLHQAFLWSET